MESYYIEENTPGNDNIIYCQDNNKPNFLERRVMSQLIQRYDITKSEAFVVIRRLYRKDNIYLSRISLELFLNKKSSDYLKRLDRFMLNEKTTIHRTRPSFIKYLND